MNRNKLKKISFYLIIAIPCIACFLNSCNDEETTPAVQGKLLQLSANIQMMGTGDFYKLEGGESVGLWISSTENIPLEEADIAQNVKFYQSAAGLVSEPRTYTGNHPNWHIYGYYPFDSMAIVSPQAYHFTVRPNQEQAKNFVASDLIWSKKTISPTNENEKNLLEFHHLMSKVVMNIRSSNPEIGGLRESSAQLINVITDAFVNLKDGSVSPAETRSYIDAMPLTNVPNNYESSLEAIVIPQTFKADVPFLKAITKGNVENEWTPKEDIVLSTGMKLVLDIIIEEKECNVTIKEISSWEIDNETLQAEAVEKRPTYKLFDFYSRFGIQGIVISLDEGTDGQHGWIISTDEAELSWASVDVSNLNGFSRTDANLNLKLALQNDPTLEKFPAFRWCDDKNKTRTTLDDLEQKGINDRWILLPVTTLKKIFADNFLAHGKTTNLNNLNTAIENSSVPASQKVKLSDINWNNPYVIIDYWSSTHAFGNTANMVECATNDYSYFGGTGVFTSMSDAAALFKVRAFCHF